MDVIYTDAEYKPLGVQKHYAIDLDLGSKNDFQIKTPIEDCNVEVGSLWYVEGEEYGGVVDGIKLDTSLSTAYISGRSWRGVLQKKILEPGAGQDYYIVSGEANTVIASILTKIGVNSVFLASTSDSGITVSSYRFGRYVDAYSGLVAMLNSVGAKMALRWSRIDDRVIIEAKLKEDLSSQYEYSDDYGMRLIINNDYSGINHLICLGQGELQNRMVVNLYVDDDGKIVTTQHYTGVDEKTDVLDYPSAVDQSELIKAGKERLTSLMRVPSMSATFDKLSVGIGDIVGGKNRATGITIKNYVASLIVTIENGRVKVNYNVGGEEAWVYD